MIVLSNGTAYPIYSNFLKFDIATRALVPNLQIAFELRFGPAVAFFCCYLRLHISSWQLSVTNCMSAT